MLVLGLAEVDPRGLDEGVYVALRGVSVHTDPKDAVAKPLVGHNLDGTVVEPHLQMVCISG